MHGETSLRRPSKGCLFLAVHLLRERTGFSPSLIELLGAHGNPLEALAPPLPAPPSRQLQGCGSEAARWRCCCRPSCGAECLLGSFAQPIWLEGSEQPCAVALLSRLLSCIPAGMFEAKEASLCGASQHSGTWHPSCGTQAAGGEHGDLLRWLP